MISLHVNSSLPRAGSELLQALLGQHPQVYASATSPLLEYWYGALGNYDMAERKSQNEQDMKAAFAGFCRAGAQGYYTALTDKSVVVDKSRGWLEYADLLWSVYPAAKIVCMTRPVEKIVESLEKIYRQHPGHPETRGLPKTTEARARAWTSPGSHPLGLALERLKDRQARGPDNRIKYVQYRDLTHDPVEVMEGVFDFLGVEKFQINPQQVCKSVPEDDRHYGIFGRHEIRPQIEARE